MLTFLICIHLCVHLWHSSPQTLMAGSNPMLGCSPGINLSGILPSGGLMPSGLPTMQPAASAGMRPLCYTFTSISALLAYCIICGHTGFLSAFGLQVHLLVWTTPKAWGLSIFFRWTIYCTLRNHDEGSYSNKIILTYNCLQVCPMLFLHVLFLVQIPATPLIFNSLQQQPLPQFSPQQQSSQSATSSPQQQNDSVSRTWVYFNTFLTIS